MAWDRGYYYRSTRTARGPRREYVGTGPVATSAAKIDAIERDQRKTEAAFAMAERREVEALDRPLDELDDLADLLARAALLAAGYWQHNRGEWRKRRVQRNEDGREADLGGR